MPAIFAIVEAAKEWLNENHLQYREDSHAVDESETCGEVQEFLEDNDAFDMHDDSAKSSEGKWDFVIGLVVIHCWYSCCVLTFYLKES